MRGHPYLHDLFTSLIHYDASTVLSVLEAKYPTWRVVTDYYITYTREEPLINGGRYADVAWILDRNDNKVSKVVLHEVKTGSYSLEEVWGKYKYARVHLRGRDLRVDSVFVWAWEGMHKQNLEDAPDTILRKIRMGALRLIPLELLLPLALVQIKELEEVLQANLSEWDPQKDYSREIKKTFRKRARIDLWGQVEADIPNIVIEYEYLRQDDEGSGEYVKDRDIIRGAGSWFNLSVVRGRITQVLVPVTCDKCWRTFFLPVAMEEVGGNVREMGQERLWAVTFRGECPHCGYPINLDMEIYEYPEGQVEAVNIIELGGCHFPNQREVNSKRMGY